MVSCSNGLLALVNVATFLLSLPILCVGIILATRAGATECEKFLQTPMIVLGVFIMIISLIGLHGACHRSSGLRWFYLVMMFFLIVVLFCFTTFTYAVTNVAAGEALATNKEYKLDNYSLWLKHRIFYEKNWMKIKSCLAASNICTNSHGNSLSRVQSSCCKPSDDCTFTNIEPRIWNKTNGDFTNPDCQKWDNNPNSLCYNCLSCKAGMLDQIKGDWKKIAQINVTILVLLMILYIIGCCSSDGSTRTTPYDNNAVYRQNPYHPQNPNCAHSPPPNPYHAQNPNASKQMYP